MNKIAKSFIARTLEKGFYKIKRCLLADTFFVARIKGSIRLLSITIIVFSRAIWADSCDLTAAEISTLEKQKVDQVIDGDTVRMADGKLVRFIGINTPEIDHQYGNSQPFADQARQLLAVTIERSNNFVLLLKDRENSDRHGRQLAHIFTPMGENIQADILHEGFAAWIVVPPNLKFMECYKASEQQARLSNKGVWGRQFRAPRDTRSLTGKDKGFQWIQGEISRIGKGKKSWWLNFSDDRFVGKFSKVTLRVYKDDLHYFNKQNLESLPGKVIRVRGWLSQRKKQLVMPLRHPAAIEFLE